MILFCLKSTLILGSYIFLPFVINDYLLIEEAIILLVSKVRHFCGQNPVQKSTQYPCTNPTQKPCIKIQHKAMDKTLYKTPHNIPTKSRTKISHKNPVQNRTQKPIQMLHSDWLAPHQSIQIAKFLPSLHSKVGLIIIKGQRLPFTLSQNIADSISITKLNHEPATMYVVFTKE